MLLSYSWNRRLMNDAILGSNGVGFIFLFPVLFMLQAQVTWFCLPWPNTAQYFLFKTAARAFRAHVIVKLRLRGQYRFGKFPRWRVVGLFRYRISAPYRLCLGTRT